MEQKKAKVIAVGNQKGGVGKTTNAVHIAAALGEQGRRVLIIDLDMNHGATNHFNVEAAAFMGSFEMLTGEGPSYEFVLTEEDEVRLPPNVHLIPASRRLEGIDDALFRKSKFLSKRDILRGPIDEISTRYDYIILDTAPNATSPTLASYMVADYFILSACPEPFAMNGIAEALQDIRDAQQGGNPRLELLGIVLSRVDKRTTLSNTLVEFVQEKFARGSDSSKKFQTVIMASTVIPQAQKAGKTVLQFDPSHRVAAQYRQLAAEVESRVAAAQTAIIHSEAVNG